MKIIRGIYLPDADNHFQFHLEAGPEFAGKGSYQMNKIEAALRVTPAERRRVAIDVGAHVGLWSRVLSHHFAEVIAFEPMPHLQECFLANTADCENVVLQYTAVSDNAGAVRLERVQENSGNCHVSNDAWGGDVVESVTLDGVLSRIAHKVDLIKIDVEGWELHVVEGARELITNARPVIVVEQKPGNAERYGIGQRDAVKLLESWGASVLWEKAGDVCLGW